MTCDVFETTTNNFRIASINHQVTSKLQFYFMSVSFHVDSKFPFRQSLFCTSHRIAVKT